MAINWFSITMFAIRSLIEIYWIYWGEASFQEVNYWPTWTEPFSRHPGNRRLARFFMFMAASYVIVRLAWLIATGH